MTPDEFREKHAAVIETLTEDDDDRIADIAISLIEAAVDAIDLLEVAAAWPEDLDPKYMEAVLDSLPIGIRDVNW